MVSQEFVGSFLIPCGPCDLLKESVMFHKESATHHKLEGDFQTIDLRTITTIVIIMQVHNNKTNNNNSSNSSSNNSSTLTHHHSNSHHNTCSFLNENNMLAMKIVVQKNVVSCGSG